MLVLNVTVGLFRIIFGWKTHTRHLTHSGSVWQRGCSFLYSRKQALTGGIHAKWEVDLTATHRCSFRTIRSAVRHGVLLHLANVRLSLSQSAHSCLPSPLFLDQLLSLRSGAGSTGERAAKQLARCYTQNFFTPNQWHRSGAETRCYRVNHIHPARRSPPNTSSHILKP